MKLTNNDKLILKRLERVKSIQVVGNYIPKEFNRLRSFGVIKLKLQEIDLTGAYKESKRYLVNHIVLTDKGKHLLKSI